MTCFFLFLLAIPTFNLLPILVADVKRPLVGVLLLTFIFSLIGFLIPLEDEEELISEWRTLFITSIPKKYIEQGKQGKGDKKREWNKRFSLFLRNIALEMKILVGYTFKDGKMKISLTVGGKTEQEVEKKKSKLKTLVSSYFPSFQTKQGKLFNFFPPNNEIKSEKLAEFGTYKITGGPLPIQQVDQPLNPLAEYFLRTGVWANYLVLLSPKKMNEKTRKKMKKQYKQRVKNVTKSISTKKGAQTTVSKKTGGALEKQQLKKAYREVLRGEEKRVLETAGYVTAKDDEKARQAVLQLHTAFTLHRGIKNIQIKNYTNHEKFFGSLFSLRHVDKGKMLLPEEAATYIKIPQKLGGIEVKTELPSIQPPTLNGDVYLGKFLRQGNETSLKVKIPHKNLRRHCLIAGVTGSGKTNTAQNLLLELHNNLDIPFLVISPVKQDYRKLLQKIPEMRIFTLGNEMVAPFRYNPYHVPPYVKNISPLIDELMLAYRASFPLYGPMATIMKKALTKAYEKKGWGYEGQRGNTVTLKDHLEQVREVVKNISYSKETEADVRGAVEERLDSLAHGSKGKMLYTDTSISASQLLAQPTVLELGDLADPDEKSLIMMFLFSRIYEYLKSLGETEKLRSLILIEEAHRVFKKPEQGISDEAVSMQREAVRSLSNMLNEVRAYGAGFVLVEQDPTKLEDSALRATSTKIIHRLHDKIVRERTGNTINLNRRQKRSLIQLETGEAYAFTKGYAQPFTVKPPNISEKGISDTIPNEKVKTHMSSFYKTHPQLLSSSLPSIEYSTAKPKGIHQILDTWFSKKDFRYGFTQQYTQHKKKGNPRQLVNTLTRFAHHLQKEGKLAQKNYKPFLLELLSYGNKQLDIKKDTFYHKVRKHIKQQHNHR